MVLIHYASGTRIPLFRVFFLVTLLLATVGFYRLRQGFPRFRFSPNLAPQLEHVSKALLLSSDGRGGN